MNIRSIGWKHCFLYRMTNDETLYLHKNFYFKTKSQKKTTSPYKLMSADEWFGIQCLVKKTKVYVKTVI